MYTAVHVPFTHFLPMITACVIGPYQNQEINVGTTYKVFHIWPVLYLLRVCVCACVRAHESVCSSTEFSSCVILCIYNHKQSTDWIAPFPQEFFLLPFYKHSCPTSFSTLNL